MADVKMIIGLGNPGKQYAGTRHNIGFDVVDCLARKLAADVKEKKFGAIFGDCLTGDVKVIMLKPMCFMNNSGQVAATAAGFYKLSPAELIVATDDLALEPGRLRIRARGSAGGHNGLNDIIEHLASEDFARLRIGIGHNIEQTAADYVLARPGAADRQLIDKAVQRAAEAILCWIKDGIQAAMNGYNVN